MEWNGIDGAKKGVLMKLELFFYRTQLDNAKCIYTCPAFPLSFEPLSLTRARTLSLLLFFRAIHLLTVSTIQIITANHEKKLNKK